MKYVSTRGKSEPLSFDECLLRGLASDGGLFVPEKFPRFDVSNGHLPDLAPSANLSAFAHHLLIPFVEESSLSQSISNICARGFNFETPLQYPSMSPKTAILELYHGPTAAFKDVGARFLAECMVVVNQEATILVATSGDTGGAVAAAFNAKPGIRVVILYPKGKISARQEKQLTCWGEAVKAFAVNGTFDDCQRVVKEALVNKIFASEHHFVSANSISIGRLLPQMVYHARASLEYQRHFGLRPSIVVPTGNLGNAVAAMWAKRAGFPIEKIILATNKNATIPDFFATGNFSPGKTLSTLANAMDVSNPSNFERMMHLYPDIQFLKDDVASISINDQEISNAIKTSERAYGQIVCPHTAIALVAKEKLQVENALIVATAHPAKFESIVEPLVGKKIPIPQALEAILKLKSLKIEIEPTLAALKEYLSVT